jgi:DNA polymerase III epsilon subunit-like protein
MRYSTDIVVIDLEATCPEEDEGANAVERSSIIEIGAVRLDRRSLDVKDSFNELVRPRHYPITSFITRITGISPAMVADKDDFGVVGERFLNWYGPRNRSMIAAFGAYYDIPLLRTECQRFGLNFRQHIVGAALDIRAIATAYLAQQKRRTSGLTLESVLEKMGIRIVVKHHRAIDDARAAAAVLQVFHLGRHLFESHA